MNFNEEEKGRGQIFHILFNHASRFSSQLDWQFTISILRGPRNLIDRYRFIVSFITCSWSDTAAILVYFPVTVINLIEWPRAERETRFNLIDDSIELPRELLFRLRRTSLDQTAPIQTAHYRFKPVPRYFRTLIRTKLYLYIVIITWENISHLLFAIFQRFPRSFARWKCIPSTFTTLYASR